MNGKRWTLFSMMMLVAVLAAPAMAQQAEPWPPKLPGAENGTVTLKTDVFLNVPDSVKQLAGQEGALPFVMAKTPPTVDLAYHGDLPNQALNGTGWSSWGDIAVASTGKAYSGIGDHGDDAGGNSHAYIYEWDPQTKTLTQVVDINAVTPRKQGESTFAKVHARIDEGPDGKIYFSGTLNDGNRAGEERYTWSEAIPGGQLFQYDPESGQTIVFANLPPRRMTATSLLDRDRNVWWCNLEAGEGQALYCIDLSTGKPLVHTPDGIVSLNRNFAMTDEGDIYFNGMTGVWHLDAETGEYKDTGLTLGEGASGMRASTRQAGDGWIYGSTMGSNQLFALHPQKKQVKLLGKNFLTGSYVTVAVLSPDEKYVYFLPGAHGGARNWGTPVVQYEIATGQRKVIAFLREAFEKQYDYVPGGTYGIKMSPDGGTLYVNLNGHAADRIRPEKMRASGFGLTSFAAIHIPESER